MKTWEMIKALTENPELKFKSHDGYMVAVMKANGCIRHMRLNGTTSCGELANIRLVDTGNAKADEWELLLEQVDFMTAIKALGDGKVIECDGVHGKRRYEPYLDVVEDQHGAGVSSEEILDGKWYIL